MQPFAVWTHLTVYTSQFYVVTLKQNGTPFGWKSGSDSKTGVSSVWPGKKTTLSETKFNRGMPRKLVWVEEDRFCGFACSECSWQFDSSAALTGKSFDEMMQYFELQRDKEFTSHVCADHPRTMWGPKRSI